MDNKAILAFAIVALVFILLPGCSLTYNGMSAAQANDTLTKNTTTELKYETDPDKMICREVTDPHPCAAMLCKNGTWWDSQLNVLMPFWFDTTLREGRCNFNFTNSTDFWDLIGNKSYSFQPRVFMYGGGPSFASDSFAQLYCNYSLQLAPKWMIGNASTPPRVPDVARGMCWLDRDSLPVYMYYTNSTNVNYQRSSDIASAFEKESAGPILLVTEVNPDRSKVSDVKRQIEAYNTCDQCLTVLSVASEDNDTLADVLGSPSWDMHYYNMVDVVGFGFRANDYNTCNIAEILDKQISFSRYILTKYQKPTIWLYAGISEGNNSDGSCQFSALDVKEFYQSMFKLSQSLASSGVIGISSYETFDRTGPLACNGVEGCDFGIVYRNGSQKNPTFNNWAGLCQYYGTTNYRPAILYSRNGLGRSCAFLPNFKMYDPSSIEVNVPVEPETGEVKPMDRIAKLTCGETCPSDSSMEDYFHSSGTGFSSAFCTIYPILDEYADSADISATYYRAMIALESSFNYIAVSPTNISNSGCNSGQLQMEAICDPAAYSEQFLKDNPDFVKDCILAKDRLYLRFGGTMPSDQKPCAFGLAQCNELPGTNDTYTANCGGTSYNPFNPGDSLCCGMNKFEAYVASAKSFVSTNWDSLKTLQCSNSLQDSDKNWTIYYIASLKYNGAFPSGGNLTGFINLKNADNGSCVDESVNYIYFLNTYHPDTLYASKVMENFISAVKACDSGCITT